MNLDNDFMGQGATPEPNVDTTPNPDAGGQPNPDQPVQPEKDLEARIAEIQKDEKLANEIVTRVRQNFMNDLIQRGLLTDPRNQGNQNTKPEPEPKPEPKPEPRVDPADTFSEWWDRNMYNVDDETVKGILTNPALKKALFQVMGSQASMTQATFDKRLKEEFDKRLAPYEETVQRIAFEKDERDFWENQKVPKKAETFLRKLMRENRDIIADDMIKYGEILMEAREEERKQQAAAQARQRSVAQMRGYVEPPSTRDGDDSQFQDPEALNKKLKAILDAEVEYQATGNSGKRNRLVGRYRSGS